ncbi:MAG: sigma-70 family RNA polymerase sigma factor [FCB group bacterium]|nr:sigma-70 family RNA polymerase sigma factor [FCB group bacterium]
MSKNKLIFQNWIVEIGYDPQRKKISKYINPERFQRDKDKEKRSDYSSEEIKTAVRNALNMLSDEEREFIIHFHFMGENYREISEKSGRSFYKLTALHKRACKKLYGNLAVFVKNRFHIDIKIENLCPLCPSPYLKEINNIIKNRDKSQTWKPIIKILETKYGIKISTPQILIGHEKYHLINDNKT